MALPSELERDIFEVAALSNVRSIPRMILVARRVKIWLEPLLYRNLSVLESQFNPRSSVRISPEACRNLLDSVSQPSPMRHVRHLALTKLDSEGNLTLRILSACPGVVRLALFEISSPAFLPFIMQMSLERLAADINGLFKGTAIDFRHSIFASLTHLDLFEFPTSGDWGTGLCSLLRLTHLSFNCTDPGQFSRSGAPAIAYILANCKRLEVLVLVFPIERARSDFGDCEGFADDPRSVTLVDTDYLDDWEIGAGGGEDYWIRAERFVQMRRSGSRVEGTRYAIPSVPGE
ncbi:hypothetical protein C8R46DRAFT_437858 [Mycena filopes]|nr:hypothetical protein C8R46DRAFT_437858 [Mycena filopes]